MSRSWTNVYVQFSLDPAERARLDAHLAARGTSLGIEFRHTLCALLVDAGIDPTALDGRPASDSERPIPLEAT